MRTVQMTLDEDLVKDVDLAARRLGSSRSEFARDAMRRELRRLKQLAAERRQRDGYAKHPVADGEFDGLEQGWPE